MKIWPFLSKSYFAHNCDFLLLGGRKQNKEPHKVFYTKLYAYFRGEYTLYDHKMLWLNYVKKMNLLGRLQSDRRNNFFFITNRLEHIRFFNKYAPNLGTNTIFFERAAQFSYKCGRNDMIDIMDNKMVPLGANNWMKGADYTSVSSRIFIIIANNNVDDDYFLRSLAWSERRFLTISPADTNSFHIDAFLSFFGNNDSLKGWHFYLNLFSYHGSKLSRLSPVFKVNQDGSRSRLPTPKIGRWATKYHRVADKGLHKFAIDPVGSSLHLRSRAAFSLKAHSRLKRSYMDKSRVFLKFDEARGEFRRSRPLAFSAPVKVSSNRGSF